MRLIPKDKVRQMLWLLVKRSISTPSSVRKRERSSLRKRPRRRGIRWSVRWSRLQRLHWALLPIWPRCSPSTYIPLLWGLSLIGSALSPPSCYPDSYARFKIAGAFVVAPLFALHVVPAWMVARSLTFMFGVGMWGQPVLIWSGKKFVEYVPDWQDLMDIRKWVVLSE